LDNPAPAKKQTGYRSETVGPISKIGNRFRFFLLRQEKEQLAHVSKQGHQLCGAAALQALRCSSDKVTVLCPLLILSKIETAAPVAMLASESHAGKIIQAFRRKGITTFRNKLVIMAVSVAYSILMAKLVHNNEADSEFNLLSI